MVFRFKGDLCVNLVLTAGPYCVSCLSLDVDEEEHVLTILDTSCVTVFEVPILDIQKIEVGIAKPIPFERVKRMGWILDGDWMGVPSYVAMHGIWSIRSSLLCALCSDLGLKGHSKLDHKRRAEFYMQHQGCSEEHIAAVLATLPEKVSRKRKNEHAEESVVWKNQFQKCLLSYATWFLWEQSQKIAFSIIYMILYDSVFFKFTD